MNKLPFYLVLVFYFSVAGTFLPASAQKVIRGDKANFQKRQVNYNAVINDMAAVKAPQKDTLKPTSSYKVANFYAAKNVYPTQSSVAFIYRLNPQLDASKPVPEGFQLKTLHFTPVSEEQLAISKVEYDRLKVPNPSENDIFFSQSKLYAERLAVLQRIMKFTSGFRDSTQKFRDSVLPGISQRAGVICAAQMQYFNLELKHILDLMGGIIQTHGYETRITYSIDQMIGDMMQITGFGLVDNIIKLNKYKANRTTGGKESLATLAFDISNFYTPWENPPNVDIYVYKSTSTGEQDTLPVMNGFDVYYDSNGYTYSLTPGCDTLSFFTIHPLSPASTLPLVLGKGNYCFILKDRSTGRISFHPNVNLSSGTFDENNRIAIPFCIDEDN